MSKFTRRVRTLFSVWRDVDLFLLSGMVNVMFSPGQQGAVIHHTGLSKQPEIDK